MRLLDGNVVLSPADLPRCDFASVRRVAELTGLLPPLVEQEFMGARRAHLASEQVSQVVSWYRREYSRMFTDLDLPAATSTAELFEHSQATSTALRTLRVVAGGTLALEAAPGVILESRPPVVLAGTVAHSVLERFTRAGDLATAGAHAHAAAQATGSDLQNAVIHLNSGRRQEHPATTLATVAAGRIAHLGGLLSRALERAEPWPWGDPTVRACGFCTWCRQAAADHRDVQLVWGVRPDSREAFHSAGITTIEELAATEVPPEGIDTFSWARFAERARLQTVNDTTGEHHFTVHNPAALAALPEPSPGDIFFDFEGDPLWVEKNRYEWGLEFLFGYIEADTGSYVPLWATSQAEEKRVFTRFLDYLSRRREAHPDMHVYHFAFYEPSTMRRLARRHRVGQQEVAELLGAGVFVDLYETVKSGVHTSGRSYGLKALEPLYMGSELRTGDVGDGAQAVGVFSDGIAARRRGDHQEWARVQEQLADYNRYDCLSTMRLRDWLLAQRPATDPAVSLAADLLGGEALDGELLITPLVEPEEDLSFLDLKIPGFDSPGVFYVDSSNSTDALGAQHKEHELTGRWGSGSEFSPGQDVLVVYSDPGTGVTDESGLLARRGRIIECESVGDVHLVRILEATPAHDPATHGLMPVHLDTAVPQPAGAEVLRAAKRHTYSLLTGPAGSGKSTRAKEIARELGAVIIDDAHTVPLSEALKAAEGHNHVLVVGDPAILTPVPRRALPVDVAAGTVLGWLGGESGATIANHHRSTETTRFHPELGEALKGYLYPGVTFTPPPAGQARLVPPALTGLVPHPVAHHGRSGESPEEVGAIGRLLSELFSSSPLAESDVLVTAAYDSQALRLRAALAKWPGVRVLPIGELPGTEAAMSIISLGVSTLADAPMNRFPLDPHILGAALTRARESTIVVHSATLLGQIPPRADQFERVTAFADLIR